MITVLEAIKLSTDYLGKKQVESPRTNAEILLAEILQCKRIELYLSFDKPLSEIELQTYRESIKKRGMRIPLQYIIGYVDFYGLKIKVDPNVLIPRPETELLVEKIVMDNKEQTEIRILDIGSGSGNIALSLKKDIINANILGIDISEEAIALAKINAELNSLSQVDFKIFDIMNDDLVALGNFDVVVSNPPYVSEMDFQDLEPELKVYEPRIALTDNSDGISFYRKIVSSSKVLLYNSGRLYFEIGKDQFKIISDLMNDEGFINIQVIKDYSGIERIICGDMK